MASPPDPTGDPDHGHDPDQVDLDLERLAAGFTAWLRATGHHGPDARVARLERPAAGHASNTFLADLTDLTDRADLRVVLRLPPAQPAHLGDKLELQVVVQELLARHGIPAPSPASYEPDDTWVGAPFVTMPCVAGHVAGEVAALDPWITGSTPDQQATLYGTFTDTVTAVHRLDWSATGVDRWLRGAGHTLDDDVAYWGHYLDWATDGRRPGHLDDVLSWLHEHRPTEEPPRSLLWGDVRLGNAIFSDDRRLRAVIDWETAWIGPAEADLGYWLVLEALVDELLGERIEGFPSPAQTWQRCEEQLGRRLLDRTWFEVLGAVSAACLTIRLSVLRHGRPPPDAVLDRNPVLALIDRLTATAG